MECHLLKTIKPFEVFCPAFYYDYRELKSAETLKRIQLNCDNAANIKRLKTVDSETRLISDSVV